MKLAPARQGNQSMMNRPKTFQSLAATLLLTGAFMLLAGCGPGNGQGLDESGNLIGTSSGPPPGGGGGGVGASGNLNATLAWVQTNVFGGVCSQCHKGGSGAPLGVDWSSETNTCSNVGRSSGEIPTMLEIESGNPDASYVIWKVEGIGPSGDPIVLAQMPLNNPALTTETIQNIRDWIADGTPGCPTARAASVDSAARTDLSGGADAQLDVVHTLGSWNDVWNESLRACTLCHSVNPASPRCSTDFSCPPGGVVLTADNYSGVVDGHTVVPFDLEGSVLWQRVIAGDHETRMPLGFAPLTQAQLDIIQYWIEDGARFCPENQVCQ